MEMNWEQGMRWVLLVFLSTAVVVLGMVTLGAVNQRLRERENRRIALKRKMPTEGLDCQILAARLEDIVGRQLRGELPPPTKEWRDSMAQLVEEQLTLEKAILKRREREVRKIFERIYESYRKVSSYQTTSPAVRNREINRRKS